MVVLARFLAKWRHALLLVKPETVLRWHREGFRLFWRRKSARAVHASRVSRPISSPSSAAWRPRTGSGEQNGFEASS